MEIGHSFNVQSIRNYFQMIIGIKLEIILDVKLNKDYIVDVFSIIYVKFSATKGRNYPHHRLCSTMSVPIDTLYQNYGCI